MALTKHGFKTNLVSFWRPNRRREEEKKRREEEGEKFKQAKRYKCLTFVWILVVNCMIFVYKLLGYEY